jgi:hypothetical protein
MRKKIILLNGSSFDTGSYFQQKEIQLELMRYTVPEKSDDDIVKKKRGRKKKVKMYFTQETEDAIVRYNTEKDVDTRHKIYDMYLLYAFDKLAENIINTFKFQYIGDQYTDIKTEVISKMLIEMGKYNQEKGKAFSYFSIIAKNHLIILNNESYKELKVTKSIEAEDESGQYTYDILDKSYDTGIRDEETVEFISLMVEYWDNNITSIFKKKRDIDIAYSVVELFRNVNSLEFFNKKALYLLIREMTGHKTQYITRVINKMTNHYSKIKTMYYNKGLIEDEEFFNVKRR